MTIPRYLDSPPEAAALTEYDQTHLKLYLRLLDAEAAAADWREVVEILFGLDPEMEPDRAAHVYNAHLKRAKWISSSGFAEWLGARLH